jgi:hypothetical protein
MLSGRQLMLSPRSFLLAALLSAAQAAIPTTTTLTSSANPAIFGRPVTLSATVSPSTATGHVTFYDGVAILETEPVVNGQAAFTTVLLGAGAHSLKALYVSSPPGYASSASSALTQTINAVPSSDFPAPVQAVDAYALLVADINGDGHEDLVTGYGIALGNGDGTFQPVVPYPTAFNEVLALGDFNGDGKIDTAGPSGSFGVSSPLQAAVHPASSARTIQSLGRKWPYSLFAPATERRPRLTPRRLPISMMSPTMRLAINGFPRS